MSPTVIMARNELRNITSKLAELINRYGVSDVVNHKQALELLQVESRTFSSYVSTGKVMVVSLNKMGQAFFSRKQILDLK